jgi:hypothetical protein
VNVLMAYATKNGSTGQVADAITAAMRERSAQVTPRRAKTVRESVAGFDLVVLEAPLYSGRWHRDAHRFLRRHGGELAGVPVACVRDGATRRHRGCPGSAPALSSTGRWPSAAGRTRSRSSAALIRSGTANVHPGICGTGRPSPLGLHRPSPPSAKPPRP